MPKLYVQQRAEDLGLPVIDGKAPVLVTVTNHDVVNAKKANSKHCALARAAMRVAGVNAAYFFRSTAYLEYPNRMVRFTLPGSVQKEIVSFDRAKIFAPGVYQLSPPEPARGRDQAKEYREKSKAAKIASEKRARNSQRKQAEIKRQALAANINKVAASEPALNTPEWREFNNRVSGIVGASAPTVLGAKKHHHHRTKYVRGMSEPG